MTGKLLAGFIGLLALCLAPAGSGTAAQITWEFTGQMEAVQSLNFPSDPDLITPVFTSLGVVVGAPFTARVTFESSTPDSFPEPDRAAFGDAIILAELSIGDYSLRSDLQPSPPLASVIFAVAAPGNLGQFKMYDYVGAQPGQPTGYLNFGVELMSRNSALFDGANLPTDPPALSDLIPFGSNDPNYPGVTHLFLDGNTQLGKFALAGSLSQIVRVPEPTLGALLVSGALALVARRRRHLGRPTLRG